MVLSDQHEIEAIFTRRGVQYTPQRRTILEFFSARPQGYTIAEAVAALRESGIGQATVYRSVFLLLDLGLLYRIQDTAEKARFVAVRPGHHHPLICRGCHGVVDFEHCDLSVLEKLLGAQTGYAIEGHHLEVYGLCPDCKTHPTAGKEQPCT